VLVSISARVSCKPVYVIPSIWCRGPIQCIVQFNTWYFLICILVQAAFIPNIVQVRKNPALVTTLFFAFSVVLHLMLLLLILPATLYSNHLKHLKHVETSYIVLRLTFSVATLVDI
jgi:hypothetical protein